jgi:hypothetical protein
MKRVCLFLFDPVNRIYIFFGQFCIPYADIIFYYYLYPPDN